MMCTLSSLMPEEWFAGGSPIALIAIVIVTMAVVIKGADWLVEGAAGIAVRLGMPKVIIGATIVSLGTTTPETAVSVLAAFSGNSGLALGNGIGSIIADTGLIFGLGCVLVALPADKFVLTRQGWVQIGSAMLLAGLCWVFYAMYGSDAVIGRPIGVLLLIGLIGYLLISVRWARQHPLGEQHFIELPLNGEPGTVEVDAHHKVADKSLSALFGIAVVGLVLIIVAGDGLVGSISELARQWSVPDAVIAGTIVALGTSLPELVVGMQSLRKGHAELLVGNVIGADILNVLFVIGASAVAAPLMVAYDGATNQPTTAIIYIALPTMIAMLLYFRLCIFKATRDGKFSRWMGWPLLAGYVAFVVLSYKMGT
ncbi:MAG: sodium:calcium antiporter [Phycisphaerales bacterium]